MEGSSEPVPLTVIAREVLLHWNKEKAGASPSVFPNPVKPNRPIRSVKTAWTTTLRNAKVAHFLINVAQVVPCLRAFFLFRRCYCSATVMPGVALVGFKSSIRNFVGEMM
jgi:hypothetical protein